MPYWAVRQLDLRTLRRLHLARQCRPARSAFKANRDRRTAHRQATGQHANRLAGNGCNDRVISRSRRVNRDELDGR